jgi:putative effector of murein hydrolase
MPEFFAQPLFGLALTVICYAAALRLHAHVRWAHPLVVTSAALWLLLAAARVPIEDYRKGADLLTLLLGPATVALAVPLYKRLTHLKANAAPILTAVALGGIVSIASAWGTAWLLQGTRDVQRAMIPRSVTTPVSVAIAAELHAPVELAATFTVVSGLLGAVLGPALLRACRIRNDFALGMGIGTAAHGIGTSSVIRRSEAQGAAAGLAMALNAIFTSVLMMPLYRYFPTG